MNWEISWLCENGLSTHNKKVESNGIMLHSMEWSGRNLSNDLVHYPFYRQGSWESRRLKIQRTQDLAPFGQQWWPTALISSQGVCWSQSTFRPTPATKGAGGSAEPRTKTSWCSFSFFLLLHIKITFRDYTGCLYLRTLRRARHIPEVHNPKSE